MAFSLPTRAARAAGSGRGNAVLLAGQPSISKTAGSIGYPPEHQLPNTIPQEGGGHCAHSPAHGLILLRAQTCSLWLTGPSITRLRVLCRAQGTAHAEVSPCGAQHRTGPITPHAVQHCSPAKQSLRTKTADTSFNPVGAGSWLPSAAGFPAFSFQPICYLGRLTQICFSFVEKTSSPANIAQLTQNPAPHAPNLR